MEVYFFIGVLIAIGIVIWLSRTTERVGKLEGQIGRLREQLTKLQQAPSREEPTEAEAPSTSAAAPSSAAEIQRSQFTAAKERTAPPPTVTPEPEQESGPPEEPAGPPPVPELEPETKPSLAPSKPVPARPAAEEKPLIEWRPILEKLNLLPPTGKNAEAAILSWWLPRIGAVSLIISAVFAGIYFSREVPPWLWILGLSGISLGVTLLGAWLERRIEAFGRLVSTAGLGIGYFTAFAAFALPATKVIEDPVLGVLVQILALAVMLGWSLWKNDRSAAAIAILLGYVSCGFSHHHDLDHFVIAGLLLLAAGGGVMLVLRNWLWPQAVAMAGSWGGFAILAIGEWSTNGAFHGSWLQAGEAPSFPVALGSLLLLAAVLEAANFLAEERGGDKSGSQPRERKWLSIINTSAAIAVGWLAIRQVAPEQLEIFFLSFAILLFAITAFRFWKGHPEGLTETFFLKGVALLALFFVEEFEGPTRWLSLAVEAGVVLWAFRRTGYRMVEIGFGAVFLGALGFIWNDVISHQPENGWKLFGIPSLAGAATLVLLSAELALHSLWSAARNPEKATDPKTAAPPDSTPVFRLLAAAFTGFAAAAFAFTLTSENPDIWRPIYLSLVALALTAPAIVIKRFPPVVAGLAALTPAYLSFWEFNAGRGQEGGGVVAAIWLALLAFSLAEVAYRFWRERWHCGNVIRAFLYGLGSLTLVDLIFRLKGSHSFGAATSVVLITLFAAIGAATVIGMSRRFGGDHVSDRQRGTHATCQWLVAVFLGGLTTFVALRLLGHHDYLSVWLALAAAILFGAAFRSRNSIPAAAGGIPFIFAIGAYVYQFNDKSDFGILLLCAIALVAVSLGTALALWHFADREKFREVRVFEAILQAAALFVIHWVFRSRLEVSEVFFADALLALGALMAGRQSPFRPLLYLSGFPLALALLHAGISNFDGGAWGGQVFWWLAAAAVFGWIWFLLARSPKQDPVLENLLFPIWNGALAAGFVTVAGYHALDNPWHLVVLAGFSQVLAGLWQWKKFRGLHVWSILPLGIAAFGALLRISGAVETEDTPGLIAASLVALGIVDHGVLLAWRNPKLRPATWAHGLAALAIAFLAFAPGALGVSELTTVCWGIAGIVVFGVGLVAGLRPYRLSGLIGLGLCLVRMFVIDIDDPLYRIFAFLATAVALLAMGYAYHRFRHRIERADHRETESGADSATD